MGQQVEKFRIYRFRDGIWCAFAESVKRFAVLCKDFFLYQPPIPIGFNLC